MNIVSITYLLCAFIAFESAITVYRLDRRAPANILSSAFSLCFCLFCFFYSQMITSPDRDTAILWHMASVVPGTMATIQALHFTLALTGRGRIASNPLVIIPMYLPSICFTVLILGGRIITDIMQTPWGWDIVYDRNSPGTYLGLVHGVLCLAAGSFLLFRWYYTSERALEKKQARPVAYSFIAGATAFLAIAVNVTTVNPFYNTLVSDMIFPLFQTIFILGVRFSVARYRLMTIHPEVPLIDIIMGINDACMLTDMDGDIICVNREGGRLAGGGRKRRIFDIFSCAEALRNEMLLIGKGKTGSTTIRCLPAEGRTSAAQSHSFILSIQGIKAGDGLPMGFIVTAKKDSTLSDFRESYGLTDRQVQIILLAISGLSNRDMAQRLDLSERTVENHLFNIYNKIGIDNRMELVNISARYGLTPN